MKQQILDYLKIEGCTLTPLDLGADLQASLYKAETPEGISYFVKVKEGNLGADLLAFFKQSKIKQIIPPIKPVEGNIAVYPFVEGVDGFSRTLEDEHWKELGKALRQIHELELPPAIKQRIRKETFSPRWRKKVKRLESARSVASDEAALELQSLMQKYSEEIRSLVEGAESLSQKVQKLSTEYVLCHSDIHGGNVLIDKENALYIVDWDEPILAPKERDLMFIGGGVGNIWNQPREEELFYQGYGEVEIDKALLSYYRQERIVQDIAEYGEALLLSAEGGEKRGEMLKHFKDMFEPNGVVEIAMHSS